MSLVPYAADLKVNRRTPVTALLIAVCVLVFLGQCENDKAIATQIGTFCSQQQPRHFRLAIAKIHGEWSADNCVATLRYIHDHVDRSESIRSLAQQAAPWQVLSPAQGIEHTTRLLSDAYARLVTTPLPGSLTASLWFDPASPDLASMFSASIAHADWMHLTMNLFFFAAFSVITEGIIGSLRYLVATAAMSIGVHLLYSLWALSDSHPVPTLGLSGVVCGVIGLMAFLLPGAKIRCLIWFVVPIGRIVIPAWILAAWFIGWDVYLLDTQSPGRGGTNHVAHVAGAAIGYLLGVLFFRREQLMAGQELRNALTGNIRG